MKKLLVLTLVLVAASTANAQLNLFYDVRPTLAAIDTPAAPFIYSASLSPYIAYGIGQVYPLQNTGHRGDGQNVYVCPKMHDVTDYIGTGLPDGVDEHISTLNPAYDWSQADAYLYAAFTGNATEVVSSIGIDATLPAAAFTPGTTFWLQSAVTTAVNAATLWDGTSITGGNAATSMKFVQVPVAAGPAYDAAAGINTTNNVAQIAQLHLVAEYKVANETPGVYNLFLSENALKITRVANPGPAAALPFNFGYAAGAPEPGTSNATPDLVVTVVRKGDFDYDGAAATGLDDYAYYGIGADSTLVNPVESWLGDMDADGSPCTGLDDYDYYKHANIP